MQDKKKDYENDVVYQNLINDNNIANSKIEEL